MAYTTIKKPSDYFNTKLYSGNGSTQSITGVGFQPDFTWIKSRGDTSNHRIYDGVRGATKVIYSNLTNVEGTDPNGLTSFDSDGFSLGIEGQSNGSGVNFASWNWLASNTTASNTDGSITSTVSANTTSGFSIVSYTGTGSAGTVGHGLGSTPKMIIFKDRSNVNGWHTYHSSFANATDVLLLDTTGSLYTANNYINNTRPTSSVFSLGNTNGTNGSSANYIAYCFADVQGFSKFGSYTGNGNADGTFIYTGFKPAFVIIKKTNGAGSWWVDDNKRDSFNPTLKALQANASAAEVADGAGDLDFLSNGFKCRDNTDAINVSGGSYIYMSFASEPLVGDNPATAR